MNVIFLYRLDGSHSITTTSVCWPTNSIRRHTIPFARQHSALFYSRSTKRLQPTGLSNGQRGSNADCWIHSSQQRFRSATYTSNHQLINQWCTKCCTHYKRQRRILRDFGQNRFCQWNTELQSHFPNCTYNCVLHYVKGIFFILIININILTFTGTRTITILSDLGFVKRRIYQSS